MHSPSDPAPGLASALGQAASATVPPPAVRSDGSGSVWLCLTAALSLLSDGDDPLGAM